MSEEGMDLIYSNLCEKIIYKQLFIDVFLSLLKQSNEVSRTRYLITKTTQNTEKQQVKTLRQNQIKF